MNVVISMRNHMKLLLLGVTAAFVAIGCGGGGSGGGPGASSSSATVFFTDDLSTNYDHVWVKVKSVSLGKVAGGSSTVFSSANGATVDLRSLRDPSGRRFKFIARDERLSGSYNSVTVTLDEGVVLFPTGSSTGLSRTFEGSTGGNKTLSIGFAAREFSSANDDLIVDFDLSTWNENGTQVTGANIKAIATDNGLDDQDRHEADEYKGTLGALSGTAPNQTFTLNRGTDSFIVQTSSTTSIFRSGVGNAVLANGQLVEVRGTFDASTNRLLANRVKIEDGTFDDNEAYGTVSNINGSAGTLDLSVSSAYFLPTGDPVHVVTTVGTTYRSRSGVFVDKATFFASLQAGDFIEAEGNYNSGSNVLTAQKLKMEDGNDGDEDNGEVKGATSQVSQPNKTFKIKASVFLGINVAAGTILTVQTTDSTEFRGLSGGDPITESAFYSALNANPGHLAEVEGFWNGTVLKATKCKLEDSLD